MIAPYQNRQRGHMTKQPPLRKLTEAERQMLHMIWRKQRQTLAATYESLQHLEEILEIPPEKRTKQPA